MPTAIQNMKRAMDTYLERNKVYGDNYKHFGELMEVLYPKGFAASNDRDWNRLGIIVMIAAKLSRYVNDPYNGHPDSIHDMGVYCFMLEEIDSDDSANDDYLTKVSQRLDAALSTTAPVKIQEPRVFTDIVERTNRVLDEHAACEHVYNREQSGILKCTFCGFIQEEPNTHTYHYEFPHKHTWVTDKAHNLGHEFCSKCGISKARWESETI